MLDIKAFDTFVSHSIFMHFYLQDLVGVFHLYENKTNASFEHCSFMYNFGFYDNAGIYSESRLLRVFCTDFYLCNASRPDTSLYRGGTCICDLASNSSIEHVSIDYCSQISSYGAIYFSKTDSENINTSRQVMQKGNSVNWCSAHIFIGISQIRNTIVYNCSGNSVNGYFEATTSSQVFFISCSPNIALIHNLQTATFKECAFIDIIGSFSSNPNSFDGCIFDKVYSDSNINGNTIVQSDFKVSRTPKCPGTGLEMSTKEVPKVRVFLSISLINYSF